jgi:Ser/Thr protein kinase RdoA (MazF antagonist)
MGFSADDAFSALSPDLIMDAVELSDREPSGQFSQLNSLENRVFSVSTDDGGRLVLKFYRNGRWNDEAILEEHSFIRELGEAGAPVCPPLVLRNGATLMQAGPFRFSAWEGFRGRIADEFDESMLFQAGRSLAMIHSVGSRSSFHSRPSFNAGYLILGPLRQLKESGSIPADILASYEECALAAASALDAVCATMPAHRIHGDFHWGNILWDGSGFRVLDFDDACVGPAAQDIWMIAPAQDTEGEEKRGILLAGYRSVRPFEESWLTSIGPLKTARFIDYSAWVAQRYGETVFKSSFPGFGSREYWESELKDIKAVLLASLPREALPEHIVKEYEAAASLTNKDYFFDME